MSIASAVTSVIDALITALNARNAPGPSDYQMWLAQGNTGTLADYRTTLVGSDLDYAAQFNSQLGSIPTAGTATEAQAGVTQFATGTEVTAATNGVKALSALRLGSVIRSYATLSDMILNLANVQEGGFAYVGSFTMNNPYTHEHSIWVKTNGKWCLAPGTVIRIGATNYVGDMQSAAGWISALYQANTSSMYLHPGVVCRSSANGFGGSLTPNEVAWSGSSWLIWNATNVAPGWVQSYQNGASGDTNGGAFEMNVVNGVATWHFNLYKGTGFATATVYLQLLAGWRPPAPGINFTASTFASGTYPAACYLDSSGQFSIGGNGGQAMNAIRGTVSYRIAN